MFVCLRLNNHRKNTKKPDLVLACKQFQQQGHYFSKHAKFINHTSYQLVNLQGSKEKLRELLVLIQNFWSQKLKTRAHLDLIKNLPTEKEFDAAPFPHF